MTILANQVEKTQLPIDKPYKNTMTKLANLVEVSISLTMDISTLTSVALYDRSLSVW